MNGWWQKILPPTILNCELIRKRELVWKNALAQFPTILARCNLCEIVGVQKSKYVQKLNTRCLRHIKIYVHPFWRYHIHKLSESVRLPRYPKFGANARSQESKNSTQFSEKAQDENGQPCLFKELVTYKCWKTFHIYIDLIYLSWQKDDAYANC